MTSPDEVPFSLTCAVVAILAGLAAILGAVLTLYVVGAGR